SPLTAQGTFTSSSETRDAAGTLLSSFSNSSASGGFLGGGILAGGLLQWLIQVPGVRAAGFSLAPSWDRGDGTVARTIRAFAPALIGLAAVQINFAVDQILVRALVDPSANTYTHLANRLLQLPLALIGISASTGVAPLFARLAAEGSFPALTRALKRSCEMSLLVILAAGGGLFLLAEPVVTVLFQHGRFDAGNTAVLAPTLRAYLWGLPAAALAGLLIRARQSRGDFRGPAWIAASVVPVNLALDWILLPRMGVPGAGYATSASLILQALFLGSGLRGLEIGGPLGIGRLPRLLAPGFLVVAAVLPLRSLLAEQAATVWGLALLVGAGIAVAAAGTAWLLPAEFQELRGALRRRGRASSQGR
ncbi:MAG: lipid II flippase MurJ, partial [Planctomycetota bacterium]